MKRFFICLAATILLSTAGCEKYLDKKGEIGLSEEDVFSRYEGVKGYLDATYRGLLDIHDWQSQVLQRTSINALSDECGSLVSDELNSVINIGDWLSKPSIGEIGYKASAGNIGTERAPVMANAYVFLRVTNKVIERAASVPNITPQQLDEILGQAYFMRGWYYFQLIQRVGGLPIYDKAYSANDNLDVPRKTYAESNEFVISNMDEAIKRLPHKWNDIETGRATKAAAMAVKEMAMLYAASPLMQNNLTSIVDKGYGIPQAERAAEYANDLIKYATSNTGGTDYHLIPGSEYASIFYHSPANNSPEEIWYNMNAGRRNQSRGLRVHYIPQYLSGGTGIDAASFNNPTQNIVDMFEMKNGSNAYPIDDARSGYDQQKPYLNRDPRFYANIVVPGQKWGINPNNTPAYQELYVGGRDLDNAEKNNSTKKRTASGYVSRKYIWEACNVTANGYDQYNVNTIYIRLAQVYLDYAEAMNEAYGPTEDPKGYGLTAVGAVNIIRNRVGMPDVLPEFTGDKGKFRDRIRNERAVELMFENHRWHDLRRWMKAKDVFSKPIKGMVATPLNPNHKNVANKSTLLFNYKVVDLATEVRVFQDKHYWYPVDQNQVDDQFNYVQNPGW
jgi:hypothetical protein